MFSFHQPTVKTWNNPQAMQHVIRKNNEVDFRDASVPAFDVMVS